MHDALHGAEAPSDHCPQAAHCTAWCAHLQQDAAAYFAACACVSHHIKTTISHQVHRITSSPPYHIKSTISHQVHHIISSPPYHIKSTVSHQVHHIISSPPYHIKSTISHQVHRIQLTRSLRGLEASMRVCKACTKQQQQAAGSQTPRFARTFHSVQQQVHA
jgi:tRNA1(Val) A37 N6-methylase TrmN6